MAAVVSKVNTYQKKKKIPMRQRAVSDLCATAAAVRQSNALILGLRNGQFMTRIQNGLLTRCLCNRTCTSFSV